MSEFGSTINICLIDCNMTQRDLAKQIGMSPQYLSDIIQGKRIPPDRWVLRFSEILNIPSDYLFFMLGSVPTDIQVMDLEIGQVMKGWASFRMAIHEKEQP